MALGNVMEHLANVRILLDCQGEYLLDNAIAELLNEGMVQLYLRKSLTVYEERRHHFCRFMRNELRGAVDFTVPEGGMTVWTKFDKATNLETLSKEAYRKGL